MEHNTCLYSGNKGEVPSAAYRACRSHRLRGGILICQGAQQTNGTELVMYTLHKPLYSSGSGNLIVSWGVIVFVLLSLLHMCFKNLVHGK